jgi:hypothetical protein
MKNLFLLLLSVHFIGCASFGGGESPDAILVEDKGKGAVSKTFRTHSEKLANCARDSITVQTGTTQEIQLAFDVTAEGKVSHPEILSMSAPDPDLRECVLRTLRKISFPKPKDGQVQKIRHPITLKSI